MTRKKHDVFDMPFIGYFILVIVGFAASQGGTIADTLLAYVIPGYGQVQKFGSIEVPVASGVCVALATLLCVVIFYFWFRPEFKGMIKLKGLGKGLLLLLPFLLFHYAGSVVSWFEWGTASSFYTVFIMLLRATAPGFGEEITYRGLGVANYMRTIKSEDGIMPIFIVSSVTFGLVHITNALAGAPLLISVIQSVYAIGVGMALAGVYLRTGNLLPTIIAHTTVDFLEFCRGDVGNSGGLMTQMGIGDWVTIAAGALGAVLGIMMVSKKHRPEIMKVWREKWCQVEG